MTATLLTAALTYHRHGLTVVPARPDGSKAPATFWKQYQATRPTEGQLHAWFHNGTYDGLGIITGTISGNLEMFEFEGRGRHLVSTMTAHMVDHGLTDLWTRLLTGYTENTPTGGLHLYYKVNGTPARNTKLARRPATPDELATNPEERIKVLIETRGEGGFTIVAPSAGRTHPTGNAWTTATGTPSTIPTITTDERDALFAIATLLDELPTTDTAPRPTIPQEPGDGPRPGDVYNTTTTWDEILTPHGWTKTRPLGRGHTWTRPGKNPRDGISATTGQTDDGVDRLYVFSTSTPFDTEKPYTKFAAYALLEHGGDYAAAARDLAARGYGTPRERITISDLIDPTTPAPRVEAEGGDDPPLLNLENTLFAATPTLATIRQAARNRLVSPWAVLGVILATVAAETPPFVVLPPTIGGDASLNLAIGLVARSGEGKSGAVACATETLGLTAPNSQRIGPGTGEGIMQTYLEWDKETRANVLRTIPHALLLADEIGQLGAIQARNGATFGPIIRTMLTGGSVSTTNADETRRRHLRAGTYRLAVVAGIQPRLSDILLADEDAGTPQRWVWLPASDPHIPDTEPDWPGALNWTPPRHPTPDFDGRIRLRIPDHVTELIRTTHRERMRGNGDPLDGHALLTREKVAAILGILHGQIEITDQMWDLSSIIMGASNIARGMCEKAIAEKMEAERVAAGKGDVLREVGARAARQELATHHARLLWRTVANGGHSNAKHAPDAGCTLRCLSHALRHQKGASRDEVIAVAVDLGWIEERDGRWWTGDVQPVDE